MFCCFSCRPAPKNEDEMMIAIFEAIDRMMNIVRPRKLLYMAIDGVVRTIKNKTLNGDLVCGVLNLFSVGSTS